jgi:Skp family chaperone for outer membrane proteins
MGSFRRGTPGPKPPARPPRKDFVMMRWSVLIAVAAAAVVTGAAVPARTARPPEEVKVEVAKPAVVIGQKTGYFNMAKVMREHKKAKTAVERLNARKDRLAANLVGMRNMYAELQAAGQRTADPRRRDELAEGVIMLARRIEDGDRALNKLLNDRATIIIVELYDELRSVAAAVARENGLTALLAYPDATNAAEAENPMVKELKLKPPALQPFYLDSSVEFTDEIIRRLNDRFDAENND